MPAAGVTKRVQLPTYKGHLVRHLLGPDGAGGDTQDIMKLTTLKPRLKATSMGRVATLTEQPATVQRLRGSAGVKDRNAIKARDNGMCQACKRKGITRPGVVVDHIEPLHLGGSDEATNKELLCDPCHDAKTAAEAGHRSRGGRW